MKKQYLQMNVCQALRARFDFLFREFDNIFVSFSGGKDSGALLYLLLDFQRAHYPHRKIGLYHQDFEAQYTVTTQYIERTFEALKDEVEPYWVCLPMATRTALSSYEMYWYPWDDTKQDAWVRPMPQHPYVINLRNPFSHYRYRMPQEELAKQFARSYREMHGGGKTVCLLGMRAEESLHRYNAFVNRKYGYKGECWIHPQFKEVYHASPLYDWSTTDVWAAIRKFGYDYNKLYDLYYKAGLKLDQMRVASPFNDYAKDSLNLYRVIDPQIWSRLVGRVRGVNFGAIYSKSKAMGYRNITLPQGYTWKDYTNFLLETLPCRLRNQYVRKFNTSIRFWHTVGGGLSEKSIQELEEKGYRIQRNGVSNYTIGKKDKVIFLDPIPDHTDDILSTKDIPSWKRMCYCILKNDHTCRFMGFGPSRQEQKMLEAIKEKYGGVLHG